MYKLFKKDIPLGDGRVITIETGKLAKQADGSVVVKMGKTMLLATVVAAKEIKEDVDFMPLSVEYKENFSAIGRFPGGFLRREGRPGDNQVLIARLVDRALRPLFPDDYHAETFVTVNLISADKDIMPDALAGLAASAALTISNVPFNGPISEVRVARVDGKLVINPTQEENQRADIDIMVGATKDDIMMVEGEMGEVSEAEMLEAIKLAHEAIKVQCQAQVELARELGTVKREYPKREFNTDLYNQMNEFAYQRIYTLAKSALPKHERSEAFAAIKEEFIATIAEEEREALAFDISQYYHDIEKKAVRNLLLDEQKRLDGRKPDEIRPIWCEVDYLPATHGSSIFTRGETQSLTTVTLGTKLDEKIIDEVMEQGRDRFLLHYNFPPFSTGDAKADRGLSRREIGHGNLAHRALKRMLPFDEDMPYTVRVVSTILESNGSSSMATVCAGTLALLDAGVKLKNPVSGIAMGLIMDEKGRYEVLSDILGDEDHLGDMDFKVTGTENGITACQMDIKINGLSYEVLEKALHQANKGRAHILDKMLETISEAREDYKPHVPRIEKIVVPKDMIGAIIGPGGKIIQEIQASTGSVIVIEEKDEQGIVMISADNKENIEAAKQKIRGIVEVPEIGNVYTGKVKSIVAFGAFVEILPGKDGLLHISEIEWKRLNTVDEVLKEGQMVEVKLIEIDKKSGKLKLSRKALLPKPEGK
jgi:polyribonucleotide nucleotidyltransferase